MKTISTILVLLLALFIQVNAASGRDINKEKKYESQLGSIDTTLVPLFEDATTAMDAGNFSVADSLYSIICTQAPSFDIGYRRLGSVKLSLGKIEEATELCEKAVSLNRSAYNLLSLAHCYLSTPDESGFNPNIDKALALVKEGQTLPDGDDVDFLFIRAQISIEQNNISELLIVTHDLKKNYPNEMATHYYAAIAAAQRENWSEAEEEILKAEELGLSKEFVQKFLDSGVHSKVAQKKYAYFFIWIVIVWTAGLFLLFVLGKFLSNVTIRSLDKLNTEQSTSRIGQMLRPIYRMLINIGGVYYYISLPIVLILVIGLVISIFYLFLLIGRIPIQLMLGLGIGALITVYGMIRSLLIKVKYSDPGRELKIEEAPELYKLVKDVAQRMGTRPIDEIRITPLTDLAVYERGSWKDKLQDKATRILILGVGVLKDFKQSDFNAVLAHEYGHFSNRDTAGGDVALRVRNDMTKYVHTLYANGQTVWWNLAFQFLRLYDFIFRRISHGATRLQEVFADRVAAQTFGIQAFQNGLVYVIKRDIEFNTYANQEIENAKKVNRPFSNLYELSGSSGTNIEQELNDSLNRKTTEDDTHPSPADRFKFISGVSAPSTVENSSYIRDLFLNWDSLTKEMTTLIETNIKNSN